MKFKKGDKIKRIGRDVTGCVPSIFKGNIYTFKDYRAGSVLIEENINDFSFEESGFELVAASDTTTSWVPYVPTGVYTIPSLGIDPITLDAVIFNAGTAIVKEIIKIPKCDCGSSKTYGENCGPEMHSSWCPRSKV